MQEFGGLAAHGGQLQPAQGGIEIGGQRCLRFGGHGPCVGGGGHDAVPSHRPGSLGPRARGRRTPVLGNARKVNTKGETVTIDPNRPLAEANWAKQWLGRVTQGLAQRLLRASDPNDVSARRCCLTCPMFVTTTEFLPPHRDHRQQVLQIISGANARGHQLGRDEVVGPRQPRQSSPHSKTRSTQRNPRMGAENCRHIIAAPRQRHELARAKAIQARRGPRKRRRRDHNRYRRPISQSVAILTLRPTRHPRRDRTPPRHQPQGPSHTDPVPATQLGRLATETVGSRAPLQRRLCDENDALRRQLAEVLGQLRAVSRNPS